MLAFFALFLGICVLDSKARESANIWAGSRVLLVTDLPNATVNVYKLHTSLAERGLADVFNRLVIVQRWHDGHFIKSHGSFRALSRVQDRPLWSVSNKEILPWLLKEEANVIICVADSRAGVPHILISAQRKGMFPLDTKLMIWMVQDDVMSADGMNTISLISPGDFDPRSSSLEDDPSFSSRKVRLISARNLESAVIELFLRAKDNAHHRERRNVGPSLSTTVAQSLPSSVSQFVSRSMTTKVSVSSARPAVGQSVTKIPSSSPAVGQSASSSMTAKVSSSSPSIGQSVSGPMTTNVSGPSSSPAVVESKSGSMTTKVSIPISSFAAVQSAPSPSSSPAVFESKSGSMTTKVSIPISSFAAVQSVPSPNLSPAVVQSVSSPTVPKDSISSSSPAVVQSISSSMVPKVSVSSSGPVVVQSVSSSMAPDVSTPSSSSAVGQPVSMFLTTNKVPGPSSSPTIGQSVSRSLTTKVTTPRSSHTVEQSVSSSMTSKVPSSSPVNVQSESSFSTINVPGPSLSPTVGQSVSSSMTTNLPTPSSSLAVTQSVSSSMTYTSVPTPSSSPAVTQSVSSSMTYTKVPIPSSSSAVTQSVSSSMTTKVSIPSSSPAAGQSMSSSLIVAPSSSVTAAPVVSSAAGQFTSTSLTTKVTAPTATLTVSPSISSSVAVRSTESAASTVSKSRSSPMVVSSFTETQATTVTVPIKPSFSIASLSTSSIPRLSSSVPSEPLGPPSTSSQKSLVATTLQPTVSSSSPVISTLFSHSRSLETSSTPLRVFSSSVTSESTSLPPTSAVILPTSTKREPAASSSRAVVTVKPTVYKNETIIIEFDGNCKEVVGIKTTEERFQQEFVSEVAGKLGISKEAIAVNDIACGSIRVTFTIAGTSGKANVSQVLKQLVDNGNISVTVDNKTFKASKLEVVQPTSPSMLAPTTEGTKKKNEIAFILYITFGALMAAIFIVGFIVLVVRCRRDRREGSFHLGHELMRFDQHSMVNFYGEPVEKDAAAADPYADDEFQAGAEAYPYDVAPTGGRAAESNRGDAKEEKFNVGAMGMPEWKNLPKLSVKEITVAEPSEDIPKSSGSVGSRQLLLDDESTPEDSRHAYDNPVLTFGDGPTGLEKEDS